MWRWRRGMGCLFLGCGGSELVLRWVLVLWAGVGAALGARPLVETPPLECWLGETKVVKSPAIRMHGTRRLARLEVSTTLSAKKDSCEMRWTVVLGAQRSTVTSEERAEWEVRFELLSLANARGRVLARMVRRVGGYGEDELVEVDGTRGVVHRIALREMRAQLEKARPDCPFMLSSRGIRADGVVEVEAHTEEDLAPGERSCMPERRWLFDPKRKKVWPLDGSPLK